MSRTITITHLARNLADIVNRVSYRGERFTVMRGKRAVAELVPAPRGRSLGDLRLVMASLPTLLPEEAEGFASEVAGAREQLGEVGGSPWES